MRSAAGEAASSRNIDTSTWDTKLQSILNDYKPCDVFNADETALFYKCLPNKTLTWKGDNNCTGQKAPKDRISLLIGANMDGSEKLPLLAVGRFAKPRCFKNIQTLPVTYKHNRKAWMTCSIFQEWLRELDRKFLREKRTIALIIDNCSAHPNLTDLRAITLVFLPPNTTSRLQPCDQGIIKNFKTIYRKRILRRFISCFDETGSVTAHFKLSLLDALIISAASWDEVNPSTIEKCFGHAGFKIQSSEAVDSEDEVQVDDFRNVFDTFSRLSQIQLSIDEFVNVDDSAETCEELSPQDIAAVVVQSELSIVEISDDDEEDEVDMVSKDAALLALDQLRKFIVQHPNGDTALKNITKLENHIQSITTSRMCQTKIDYFFKPA